MNHFIAEIWIDEKLGKTWVKMTHDGRTKKAPREMKELIDVAIDQIIPTKFSRWHRKFTPKPSGEVIGKAIIKIPKNLREEYNKQNKTTNTPASEFAEAFQKAKAKAVGED